MRIWDRVVRQNIIEEGTYSRDSMEVEVKVNSQVPDLNTRLYKGSILWYKEKRKSKVLEVEDKDNELSFCHRKL